MEETIKATAHRPYPMPAGPWIMTQTWHDLLFAHWPASPDHIRPLLPQALRPFLDTYEGQAWVGVIPFWMSNVRMRGLPGVPTASTFAELNVRTYVTVNGKPGVYFFSLDAESRLAVMGARIGFGLNYFFAKMSVVTREGDRVEYQSRRSKGNAAEFVGEYAPASAQVYTALQGSIEQFVVERYCLYTTHGRKISRTDIHHLPWPLQRAKATINTNTMAQFAGFQLPKTKPLLHFAKQLDVLVWPPERA